MNSDKPEYYSNTAWITLMMKDKVEYYCKYVIIVLVFEIGFFETMN